ncbi:hypothetical protein SVIO_107950 [Streptomyces violaceusniger]|uniref:Uncharacterized protein n=1 Tax=Streptomyces violaceusniger TaxID=68280 RepID=A0A4D4LFV2_STRVO|nr:hypothetical protein SVIO_107950 [Streptomyces violaceusniger]
MAQHTERTGPCMVADEDRGVMLGSESFEHAHLFRLAAGAPPGAATRAGSGATGDQTDILNEQAEQVVQAPSSAVPDPLGRLNHRPPLLARPSAAKRGAPRGCSPAALRRLPGRRTALPQRLSAAFSPRTLGLPYLSTAQNYGKPPSSH